MDLAGLSLMIVFAFGSNLHLDDLAAWCRRRGFDPRSIALREPAWLPDMEPVYHYRSRTRGGGALDVRPRRGGAVPGALLDATPEGWAALDAKEGHPHVYQRATCHVLTRGGAEVTATTYLVTAPYRQDLLVPPTDHYRGLVRDGLGALGMPSAPQEAAAEGRPRTFPAYLFVYGTLRPGRAEAARLAPFGPRRATPATIPGRLVDLGAFPGLVAEEGRVEGALVELTDLGPALEALDAYEDFMGYGRPGSLYRRVVREARTLDGRRVHAWTYLYLGSVDGARRLTAWPATGGPSRGSRS
ncbi:MAG: gamma-glutamylcyclotransferase [Sandaracinaceae bacterium]